MSATTTTALSTAKVGLLHSLSGTMAISERSLLDVELMAIEEVNAAGGVLGRTVEPVTADGESRAEVFADRAQELLDAGVDTLFGCWTSASRKAVKPVVESADGLLWYPVQYEGLEESRHIVYTGSSLNQQITPALEWALAQLGGRVFLLGSDYVFPRTANLLVRALTGRHGPLAHGVGERYVPLGEGDLREVVREIAALRPDFVFNTLNGDSNLGFFRQLGEAGLVAAECPVVSVSVSEVEMASLAAIAAGHYACWNYFQSLESEDNRLFVERFRQRYGETRVVSAPMVLSWYQIHLWKQAVEAAGSFAAADVREHVVGQARGGPTGTVTIYPNHHVGLPAHVGRGNSSGQFEIVWSSDGIILPLPWLGLEETDFPAAPAVREALAVFPDAIHQKAVLEDEIQQRIRTEAALTQSRQELETRVRERTRELEQEVVERKRMQEIAVRQAEEILSISTPVMQVWDGIVVAPLIGTLDSGRTQGFMDRLLGAIVETDSAFALVDITGVPTVDTHTAQHIIEAVSAARLLGTRVVLTGIRPAIAQTLVHLGVDLSKIDTCASLSAGLRRALTLLDKEAASKA